MTGAHLYRKLKVATTVACVFVLGGCANFNDGVRPAFHFTGYTGTGEVAEPLDRGKAHFAIGQYGLAIQSFTLALGQDSQSVSALNGIAASYDKLGRFDVADRFYDRALKIDPQAVEVLNNVGYSHLLRGEPEAGERFLRLAASLDASNPVVQTNLVLAMGESAPEVNPLLTRANLQLPNAPLAGEQGGVERAGVGGAPTEPRVRLVRIARGVQALLIRPDSSVADVMGSGPMEPRPMDSGPMDSIGEIARIDRSTDVSSAVEVAKIDTDPEAVKMLPPPARGDELTIEVSNGTGRESMAARMREYLNRIGIVVDRLTNDDSYSNRRSLITYRPHAQEQAGALSQSLPMRVPIKEDRNQPSDLRLILGADLLDFDVQLIALDRIEPSG